VIDVEHGDGEWASVASGASELFGPSCVEVDAVPEARKAVDLGALGEHAEELVHAEGGAEADAEFGEVEGLGDVVDGAEVEGGDFVLGALEAGEDDDGDLDGGGVVLEGAEDFEAVHAGHVEVEEDEEGLSFFGQGEALLARGGADELDVLGAESSLEEAVDVERVVDEEDDGLAIVELRGRGGHACRESGTIEG
jgi:hypothetical protein